MKILLVTRGSQGDIYPYLTIASALIKRGHQVTLNLPQIFEKEAKAYQLDYVLQDFDDIQGMVSKAGEKSEGAKPYLKWMRDVIDVQFKQLIPLLKEHDILIATNSEFAAASVVRNHLSGLPLPLLYPAGISPLLSSLIQSLIQFSLPGLSGSCSISATTI